MRVAPPALQAWRSPERKTGHALIVYHADCFVRLVRLVPAPGVLHGRVGPSFPPDSVTRVIESEAPALSHPVPDEMTCR
jgi:hypothetical protein